MPPLVLYRPEYLSYDFGPEHPFSPLRLSSLLELLSELGLPLQLEVPPLAEREDLLGVHSEAFVRRVEAASRGEHPPDLEDFGLGTSDTPVFLGMDLAARALVGGTLEGARRILRGAREVLQLGGGLHHAQHHLASGFCVYNDLAVAIRELRRAGLRVAYLDLDVHHGDGVQWIYYEDPEILTLSLHESGRYLFPGTGGVEEIGRGEGLGKKLNLPLEPFTDGASYLEVFEQVVEPALSWFRPDVLVVQSGVDGHFLDPLADLYLQASTYAELFRRVRQYAQAYAGGRALYTLGGGYDLDATSRIWTLLYAELFGYTLPEQIPEAWRYRWQASLGRSLSARFFEDPEEIPSTPRQEEIRRRNQATAARLLELVRPYWR